MSSESFNDANRDEKPKVLFVGNIESSSSEELPIEQWSSFFIPKASKSALSRKDLLEEEVHDTGSGEICAKYIRMSDSSVYIHPYYNYPAVLDPGIKPALLYPEPQPPPYSDDGYELYMDLCKEHNVCPVRLFYSNLLNPEIDLKYYCVSSPSVRMMAIALQRNNYVKRLNLTDNYINIDACYHLGQMILTNTTLTELIIDGCMIGEVGLRNLTVEMKSNYSIKTFSLARNDLNDIGGELFARVIFAGAQFEKINLSYNNLGVKTAVGLHEALEIHNILTHIDMSRNPLVNVGAVVQFLKTLADTGDSLQELNLSYTGLSSDRVAEAIALVTQLNKIKFIDLRGNKFSDDSAPLLVSKLMGSKLQVYDLSDNEFSPAGACKLLVPLTKPTVHLKKLFLDNICVNRTFIGILARVQKMKIRKNFVITFDRILHDWVAIGADPRSLILRRGDFMGKMKKKAPKDVPMFLLSLSYAADYLRPKELIVMMKDQRIPTNDDWVDGLTKAFPGPVIDKKPTVNSVMMREFIKRLWPNLRLPPDWTPPIMIRVDVKKKKVIEKTKSAIALEKKMKKK